MNSFPTDLPPGFDGLSTATAARLKPAQEYPGAPGPLARQWQALHRAASAVAALGGIPLETLNAEARDFPERIALVSGWRGGLARQGVADLAAVMEPGLTALISVHSRGADPAPAARALLQEFTDARDALLTLAHGDDDNA